MNEIPGSKAKSGKIKPSFAVFQQTVNAFLLSETSYGVDYINGFSMAAYDILNLSAPLYAAGWRDNSVLLSAYLKVSDFEGNATIAIAPDGLGAGIAVATLNNVGNVSLADFLQHNALIT